jgi:hypothetical protein
MTLEDRFLQYVFPEPNSGCWLWDGSLAEHGGYGQFNMRQGKGTWIPEMAHRVSYKLYRGPIPADNEIGHLCRINCCVNPDHLVALPHKETTWRGDGPTGRNHRKTHCKRGHPLSGENLYVSKRIGERRCRECARIADRRRSPRY